MNRNTKAILAIGILLSAGQVFAVESSPYAGEEVRAIKSLSEAEIDGLLAGAGLGYAKAAELNGYPGPAHVLELSEKLSLSAEQRRKTEAIFSEMQTAAQELGARLVAAERELNEAFKNKAIDDSRLSELVMTIGDIESRLRAVHLRAHLRQAEILDSQQVSMYMALRGYRESGHEHHQNMHHGH